MVSVRGLAATPSGARPTGIVAVTLIAAVTAWAVLRAAGAHAAAAVRPCRRGSNGGRGREYGNRHRDQGDGAPGASHDVLLPSQPGQRVFPFTGRRWGRFHMCRLPGGPGGCGELLSRVMNAPSRDGCLPAVPAHGPYAVPTPPIAIIRAGRGISHPPPRETCEPRSIVVVPGTRTAAAAAAAGPPPHRAMQPLPRFAARVPPIQLNGRWPHAC